MKKKMILVILLMISKLSYSSYHHDYVQSISQRLINSIDRFGLVNAGVGISCLAWFYIVGPHSVKHCWKKMENYKSNSPLTPDAKKKKIEEQQNIIKTLWPVSIAPMAVWATYNIYQYCKTH